ncbi:hypothetical protein GF339_05090 [candidate division KSB3 bacterium]|uniref:Uncharacterized protein n=1 Tax=candidate division KSB3 bacterium TaxID=2044937 RepID=A0A9D5JUJ1_9BACT|nr:hypothetical protein [candidate division KSB3 bacterium]MBD3323936.1 hypothetical protein [candidate division KSB3 bacterium]
MLQEYTQVRQIEGEGKRRWFSDEYFDLIVWYDSDETQITGFQLCYDIGHAPRAFTWQQDTGSTHHRIDDGENRPGKFKATPVLVPDGRFAAETIAHRFQQASRQISPALAQFIYAKILQYSPA